MATKTICTQYTHAHHFHCHSHHESFHTKMAIGEHRWFGLLLFLVICSVSLPQQQYVVSGILLTHPEHRNHIITSSQNFYQPHSLLARSLDPIMGAISILPSGYLNPSNIITGGGIFHPYSTFARFPASGGPIGLYPNQWNVLPFSVGRYCEQQIITEPQYQQCRANAAIDWRAAEHNFDDEATTDQMRYCCFLWSILSCMEDSVRRRCFDSLEYFRQRRSNFYRSLESLNGVCYNYPHNAFRCVVQGWIFILAFIILSAFVLVVIISIVWILIIRKRKNTSDLEQRTTTRINNQSSSRSGRLFNPFRSEPKLIREVESGRAPTRLSGIRVPDLQHSPVSSSSHQHLQYSTNRQISL